ncbi:MAG: hypothetical protein HS109_08700 [Burkholderiales bacterium]|nr:hypothetical protein [Burkholderiales bacterium]
MQVPAFFQAVPPIVTHDPLAETLGAAEGGVIEYAYVDAVKLAGHSCPTVAGAWLMTAKALARLYGDALPRRGEVRVEVRQMHDEGVAGVIGAVVGLVTGAAGDGGFKGLAGRHSRRNLISYGAKITGDLRFTRIDTGAFVEVACHPEVVERPAGLRALMQSALAESADAGARRAFALAWQEWVRRMLVERADDPELVTFAD